MKAYIILRQLRENKKSPRLESNQRPVGSSCLAFIPSHWLCLRVFDTAADCSTIKLRRDTDFEKYGGYKDTRPAAALR